MRLHISLDDDLVAELDTRVGERERSDFIAAAVRRALDDQGRWELIRSGIGSVRDDGTHAWDDDAASWVRAQRVCG